MESKPVEMFVKGHLHRRFCSAFSLFDKNIGQQLFQYLTDDKNRPVLGQDILIHL